MDKEKKLFELLYIKTQQIILFEFAYRSFLLVIRSYLEVIFIMPSVIFEIHQFLEQEKRQF